MIALTAEDVHPLACRPEMKRRYIAAVLLSLVKSETKTKTPGEDTLIRFIIRPATNVMHVYREEG